MKLFFFEWFSSSNEIKQSKFHSKHLSITNMTHPVYIEFVFAYFFIWIYNIYLVFIFVHTKCINYTKWFRHLSLVQINTRSYKTEYNLQNAFTFPSGETKPRIWVSRTTYTLNTAFPSPTTRSRRLNPRGKEEATDDTDREQARGGEQRRDIGSRCSRRRPRNFLMQFYL